MQELTDTLNRMCCCTVQETEALLTLTQDKKKRFRSTHFLNS